MLLKNLIKGGDWDQASVVEVIAFQEGTEVFQIFSLNLVGDLFEDFLDILEVLLGIDGFSGCFTVTEDSFELSNEVTDKDDAPPVKLAPTSWMWHMISENWIKRIVQNSEHTKIFELEYNFIYFIRILSYYIWFKSHK